MFLMARGMMCLPKSVRSLSSSFMSDFAVENINAHGGQEQFAVALDAEFRIPIRLQLAGILHGRVFRLFNEARDAAFVIDLHDAEGWATSRAATGMVAMVMSAPLSTCCAMMRAEIHAIQLIAAQDQQVIEIVIQKVDQVLANGIGGALIPRGVGKGLFGGKNLDEAAGEMVELVGLRNVAMQRGGIELSQQIDPLQAGIDAVGNGNIDKPIFAGQRNGWFGAIFGERKKSRARAAAHNDGKDTIKGDGFVTPWNVPLHGSVMSVCFGLGKQIERDHA